VENSQGFSNNIQPGSLMCFRKMNRRYLTSRRRKKAKVGRRRRMLDGPNPKSNFLPTYSTLGSFLNHTFAYQWDQKRNEDESEVGGFGVESAEVGMQKTTDTHKAQETLKRLLMNRGNVITSLHSLLHSKGFELLSIFIWKLKCKVICHKSRENFSLFTFTLFPFCLGSELVYF